MIMAVLSPSVYADVTTGAPKALSDTLPGDTIYYDGVDHSFMFVVPNGWLADTVNAYFDGYTMAMFPGHESYFNATRQILVWVLDLDSLTFEQFITVDSAHLAKTKKIIFKRRYSLNDPLHEKGRLESKFGISRASASDTAHVDTCIVLEIRDPGGVSREAMIAYCNAGSEIVIFQLNISGPVHSVLSMRAYEKVLKSFKLTK